MSVIRRRKTAHYTTIGNELFEDERLAADEVGILAFLLSKPDDWDVRRAALGRRWKIGRDGMKRIMNNWLRTGWCMAQKTRLPNGTFHIVYEIRDEPGPELSDEDIRRALSLVSSEAADDDSDDGETENRGGSDRSPPTPQPGVVDHLLVGRASPIEDSLNPELPNTESTNRARDFADVKAKWPVAHVLSEVAAQRAFLGFGNAEKEAAFHGIKLYLDDCSAQGRIVCDLTTYLREKRWQRFEVKAKGAEPAQFPIKSPQWWRWRQYKVATGQSVKFMDNYATSNPKGIWTEPTEWPPAMPPKPDSESPPEEIDPPFSKTG